MIKNISIKNFKSIKSVDITVNNLTLLFGMNGMGKSSTIQSILLCRQSYWKNGKMSMDYIYPFGALIDLGTADDIFCSNADENSMLLEYEYDEGKNSYTIDFPNDDIYSNKLVVSNRGKMINGPEYGSDFIYLSAEHIGPRRKYDYSTWEKEGINKFGLHGEYVVPYLAMYGDNYVVPSEMCIRGAKSDLLNDQVSAWMELISPGVRLNTELISPDQEAKLKISYNEEWSVSKNYAPINVGYGIPYVLPIIVAILASKRNSLILIENPESHLHPKGQSAIARLIAIGSAYGEQIICESHSDHIINGIRVAVKENCISKDEVSTLYYSKDKKMNSIVTSIRMDSNGNLDNYPEGLLDEWGELMSRLI